MWPRLKFNFLGMWSTQVAYQIKRNDTYSNMVANILPVVTPLIPGVGQKVKTFFFSESGHDAYQIKGN